MGSRTEEESLLERILEAAVLRLSPEEHPVFQDLFAASLRPSPRHSFPEGLGVELSNVVPVVTQVLLPAAQDLVREVGKSSAAEKKDKEESVLQRKIRRLFESDETALFRLRENAEDKAVRQGLGKEEARVAAEAFLSALAKECQ